MFERFTGWARKTVVLAQEEAFRLGHGYLGADTCFSVTCALGEFPPVREVTLRITKLQVPVDHEVSGISVEAAFVR